MKTIKSMAILALLGLASCDKSRALNPNEQAAIAVQLEFQDRDNARAHETKRLDTRKAEIRAQFVRMVEDRVLTDQVLRGR